jgi:hypothetical protein
MFALVQSAVLRFRTKPGLNTWREPKKLYQSVFRMQKKVFQKRFGQINFEFAETI